MLTPEIMPNTWKFSQQSLRLEQNLSGGNGTRQGLFALMYGLYGAYRDVFLRENQGLLLLDVLKQQNYRFYMATSASSFPPWLHPTCTMVKRVNRHGKGMCRMRKRSVNSFVSETRPGHS
jgi:membrane-anchored protein YejM (alkaline phosphatase superfamily)